MSSPEQRSRRGPWQRAFPSHVVKEAIAHTPRYATTADDLAALADLARNEAAKDAPTLEPCPECGGSGTWPHRRDEPARPFHYRDCSLDPAPRRATGTGWPS